MRQAPKWFLESLKHIDPLMTAFYDRQWGRWGLFIQATYEGRPNIKICRVGMGEGDIPIYRARKAMRLLAWISTPDGRYAQFPNWQAVLEQVRLQKLGMPLAYQDQREEKAEKDFDAFKFEMQSTFKKDLDLHQTTSHFDVGRKT